MSANILEDLHIALVLECIRIARKDGAEFLVSDYVRVHAALFPEDEEKLRRRGGDTLAETAGGRLSDYAKSHNGQQGPFIEKVAPAPDPKYRIVGAGKSVCGVA